MDIPTLSTALYAAAVLHAGYLLQLAFRQPSSKTITSPTESHLMYLAASPKGMLVARIITLLITFHHVTLALSLSHTLPPSPALQTITCSTPQHLDPRLFTWSLPTILTLSSSSSLAQCCSGSDCVFWSACSAGTLFAQSTSLRCDQGYCNTAVLVPTPGAKSGESYFGCWATSLREGAFTIVRDVGGGEWFFFFFLFWGGWGLGAFGGWG